MAGKRNRSRERRHRGKERARTSARDTASNKPKRNEELPTLKHVREDLRKIGLTAAITAGTLVAAAILVRAL